jgi:hypothetical protein
LTSLPSKAVVFMSLANRGPLVAPHSHSSQPVSFRGRLREIGNEWWREGGREGAGTDSDMDQGRMERDRQEEKDGRASSELNVRTSEGVKQNGREEDIDGLA